ncbi:class I SAM-dependent methyltransferase [Allohahella sp. A8]|uniref:class I SAM-dependent methyltransferase n=1 Tax=Allohahella sp. A8 TaxID=3141461 RepID=UPI000C08E59E|nr:SAM-dependent methyltransferase [Hahellaceae bacterium]|tara:strand:- start:1669 stop:2418 length:750 start_codon:yes stop_codon:yes gene_type:complete
MQSAQQPVQSANSPASTAARPAEARDKYRFVGPVYDLLSAFYSGKAIHEAKVAMLDEANLKAGDSVLFAGVGHGKDAIHAAERGARVTVVDLSETMLRKFDDELVKQGKTHLDIRRVQADIFKFEEFGQYDMVVGNFFLNVFSEDMMDRVLKQLIDLAKDDGKIVVGDFALPQGNILRRQFQKAYWYVAVSLFWLTAGNALHNIYDYPAAMRRAGLEIKSIKRFSFAGLANYWSILGDKQAIAAAKAKA